MFGVLLRVSVRIGNSQPNSNIKPNADQHIPPIVTHARILWYTAAGAGIGGFVGLVNETCHPSLMFFRRRYYYQVMFFSLVSQFYLFFLLPSEQVYTTCFGRCPTREPEKMQEKKACLLPTLNANTCTHLEISKLVSPIAAAP